MKKLICLFLVFVLLLAGCSSSGKEFPVSLDRTMEMLSQKAENLSVNAFELTPTILEDKDGTGYSYNLGGGIRIAFYGNKAGFLTSAHLSVTTAESNDSSKTLQEEYFGLLIEHFVPAGELESVKTQLGGHTTMNKMASSSVTCSAASIIIQGDGTTTYLTIEPA